MIVHEASQRNRASMMSSISTRSGVAAIVSARVFILVRFIMGAAGASQRDARGFQASQPNASTRVAPGSFGIGRTGRRR
jgi:hypothetical protein